MRRLVTGSILATAIVGGTFAQAAAVPGHGVGQATFPMVCDGAPVTLTIGGGTWSAAYVRETGGRFLPKGTRLVISDLATGAVVYEHSDMKNAAGRSGSTCIDVAQEDGMQVTFVVYGKLR